MQKPLGYNSYFKSNKRKVIGIILSIALSITLIGIMNMYADSMTDSELGVCRYLKHMTEIYFKSDKKQLDILNKIRKSPYVDRIIGGYKIYYGMKTVIGTHISYSGYITNEKDIQRLLKLTGQKLIEGRYPHDGKNEIIISENTAKARNIKIGGFMGQEVRADDYFQGKYKVTGILSGDTTFSFIPFYSKTPSKNQKLFAHYLIIPKSGKISEMNKFLNSISSKNLKITTYSDIAEEGLMDLDGFNSVFNIVILVILLVLSVTLGLSSYVHYFQRRPEFGLLKAVGYKKDSIIYRMAKEISVSTFIGFFMGYGLLFLFRGAINFFYLIPEGISPFHMDVSLIPKALSIPVTVSIFSVIPASRLLLKVEPISIIERVV